MSVPVARFRGYLVEVSMEKGSHVFLGRHVRAAYDFDWDDEHTSRHRTKSHISAGNASPGLFYSKASAKLAIRNCIAEDKKGPKHYRTVREFRIITVTFEVKMKLRVPVGFVEEPAIAACYKRLAERRPRRRRNVTKKDLLG